MKTLLIPFTAALLMLNPVPSHADTYLCTYKARISETDKHNSSGARISVSAFQLDAVAAILRQDRANYHMFGRRDLEDLSDCAFNTKQNRDALEIFVRNGRISEAAMRKIIYENPLISVDVYQEHIDIQTLAEQVPVQITPTQAPMIRSTIR